MTRDKYEKIQLPRRFGINAENSVLVKNMRELKRHAFVKDRDSFSVRTYYHSSVSKFKKAPHLVTTGKKRLFKRAPRLFRDGLWLIVADKVDAKDCEFRGTIWINENDEATVEIATGPGTVRTVTNDGVIDERYLLITGQYSPNIKLNECVSKCRSTELRNVIFEFSYYGVPVGWKNERFICWEITDDGSHKCRFFKK